MPVPAIEGWFTTDDEPTLLGTKCTTCGTVYFPRVEGFCKNPACRGREFEETALSRRGKVWSYTDAQYQPPAPYISGTEPYQPFTLAAVELADEQLVVLGQLATGCTVDDIEVGSEVELVIEPAYEVDGETHLIYKWRPC
jgi:uncharacterized OB-fold protein